MSVKFFIDTNLFIYQLESQDQRKATIANRIIRDGIRSGEACISFQVVQECLNTILRKAEICLSTIEAEDYLEAVLSPLMQIYPSTPLYKHALATQARFQFSFYDSLIIAATLETGCQTLYSEDFQHGQRIEQLTINNPFKT